MRKTDIIRAWKDAEYRKNLSEDQKEMLEANPVGNHMDNLDQEQIKGGWSGWWCTVSGECNGGVCCNPFGSDIKTLEQ